ncbi:putative G-protein coupled receptor Mth-like 12 [Folsomia candida]|uniref:Putative G-protein coupled receptor Mth-like 12 n=1 Tax=Folsomia candida TaxID=158441 RepID=A0A226F268_FOLCA|nr:putative G-protein coupled receptor Mth-like 12 [Folsomia candida]
MGTLVIVLTLLVTVTEGEIISANFQSLSTTESSKYLRFECPDPNSNVPDGSTFCKVGTIPREKTLNIHSEEIHHGNYSLTENNFFEHRVCVKATHEDQVVILRCDLMYSSESEGLRHGDNEHDSVLGSEAKLITLRKCCRPGQRLLKTNSTKHEGMFAYECVEIGNGTNWNPALFDNVESDFGFHIDLRSIEHKFVYRPGFPSCRHRDRDTDIKMMDNKEDIWHDFLFYKLHFPVLIVFRPVWLPVHNEKYSQSYCLDELELSSGQDNSHEIHHTNQALVYCGIERFSDYLFHRKLFGILCVSASCVILMLLIIYLSIWDRQNLAGWTQFNIFLAVFFVFGMEGMRTLIDYNGLDVKSTFACTIIAAIAQYFFFALNTTWCVMNSDLLWTFWKLESSAKGLYGKGRRVAAYLAFSWGLPLIVIVLLFGFKHHEAKESKEEMRGIYSEAHRRCSSPIREFGFQTQGVLFLFNIVFFVITAFLIWKHRRGITNSRRNTRSERYTWRSHAVFGRVVLFAKLLIVMGVSSVSIPLDYFFGSEDPLNIFEVLFRMVHFIPVVAILFIFGFNEKNLHLIKQKYPNFGTVMGVSLFNLKPLTTETNQSPSGGQNSMEIK